VRVGRREDLARASCTVRDVTWQDGTPPPAVLVQLRHHHEPEPARLAALPDGAVRVHFVLPSLAVTPGQYAVFYAGDVVLGAGRIAREPAATADPSGSCPP
jgi:tRNA-specific 2-thiouridylase